MVRSSFADVVVTQAIGAQGISADKSVGGPLDGYTALGNIVISSTNAGDFTNGTNRTLIFTRPTGWQFEAGIGAVSFTGPNITSATIGVTATTITVTYTASGTAALGNSLTISGIQVQSTSKIVLAEVNLTRSGGTGVIAGFVAGTIVAPLSKVAGAITSLQVLLPGQVNAAGTATGKSGTVTAQTAGVVFPVVVNAVDYAFNIVTVAPNDEINLTSNNPGAIIPSNINLINGSATFNSALGTASPTTAANFSFTATDVTNNSVAQNTSTNVRILVGTYSKLLLLLPGEIQAPGTQTGKTGTPSDVTSNVSFNVTVVATDDYWNKVSATNTIQVTSTDPLGTNPVNNTLSAGARTFSVRLKTVGNTNTITATDVSPGTGIPYTTDGVNVLPGAFSKLQLLLPGEEAAPGTTTGKTGTPLAQVAGVPFNVTVNAVDANWNIISNINDVVSITNVNATYALTTVLSPDAALTAGTGTFSVTFTRAIAQQLKATDVTDGTKTVSTSPSISVDPGAFVKLQLLLPGETAAPGTVTGKTGAPTDRTANTAFNVTVNAVDDYWNRITTITDEINLSSTDLNALIPANAALVAGTKANFSITLKTVGTAAITAVNATNGTIDSSQSANVNVLVGAFAKLQLLLPGESAAPGTTLGKTGTPIAQTVGVPFNVRVNAVDAAWNLVSTAADEVAITSNDVNVATPSANAVLVNGTQEFSVVLKTAATNRTITATDLTNGARTLNTSPSFTMAAGSYAKILVLLPNQSLASGTVTGVTGNPIIPARGTQFQLRIRAVDEYFNVVNGITNTLTLAKSSVGDVVPASSSMVTNNYRNLNVTINAAGLQTVTVTDDATAFSKVVNIPEPTGASLISDHFRSASSGAWNNASTWESSADLITWQPATLTPTNNSATITIQSGSVVDVTATVSADELTIQVGGVLNINAGTFTIANGGNAIDMLVEGTLTNKSAITVTGNLEFASTGKYQHKFTTVTGIIPAATWNTGAVCEVVGYTTYTGNISGSGQTFSDFVWNCPDQNISNNGPALLGTFSARDFTVVSTGTGVVYLGATGGTSVIDRNFRLTGGNVVVNKTSGTRLLNVAGNFALDGGSLKSGTGTVNIGFIGNTPQYFSNVGIPISGDVNFEVNSSAIVDFGTAIIDGTSGNFTMSAGATLITANSNGLMAAGTYTGTIQNTGSRLYNTAGNYTYNGNVSQSIGTGLPLTVNNLTILNAQGVTFPSGTATYNINGVLSIQTGFLDMGQNILGGTFTNTGFGTLKTQATNAFSVGKTWSIGVEFNSSANQNIIAGTYNRLLAASGSGLKTGPSGILNVNGDWSSAGGRVDLITNNTPINFSGLSSQSLVDQGSNSGQGIEFNQVVFSNSGIKTLTSGNFSVSADGVLTLSTNTSLNANGHLSLLSSATNSARIAPIPSTSSITGAVNVQRYVTGGNMEPYRTYRMFSSPVYDNTASFINSDNPGNRTYKFSQFIDDIIVTGAGGALNGFDNSPTNSPSAWAYNNGFVAVGNITTSVNVGQGSYLFYRGNRSSFSSKVSPPFMDPENEVIDFDGVLNQQDITVPLTYSASASGYNLVGNPYASTIDWNSAGLVKSNMNNVVMIWNPAIRQYATYDGNVGVNGGSNLIPSGQGFFVQSTNGSGSLKFTEAAKISNQPLPLILNAPSDHISLIDYKVAERPQTDYLSSISSGSELRVFVKKENSPYEAEAVIVFKDGKSANFVQGEDVAALAGNEIYLSTLSSDNKKLVINYMPAIGEVPKINFSVDADVSANYRLKINLDKLPSNTLAKLNDAYLNTSILLNGSDYNFTIDKAVVASYGANRFSISFEPPATLPVALTSYGASKVNEGVLVKWSTGVEANNNRFEVERAGENGIYTSIGSTKAKGSNSSYSLVDKSPLMGNNYYRLVQYDNDGKSTPYRPIAINYTGSLTTSAAINIYPNPVKEQFTIKYNGVLFADQQTVRIVNPTGQILLTKLVAKAELVKGYQLNVADYPAGIYIVELIDNSDKLGQAKLIKE